MTVYNNFPSSDRYESIPQFDRLIWAASLARNKYFGYTTKIYCLREELDFLSANAILPLYDEVDVDTFADNARLSKVNGKAFWSSRKIECIWNESQNLGNEAIYSDTDILMRMPFFKTHDALVWSPDNANEVTETLYPPWQTLSKPEGFNDRDFLQTCNSAYNLGVLWVKDSGLVREWINLYYEFAINNPCLVDGKKPITNDIFPCNAEQRTIRALLERDGCKVRCIMDKRNRGLSPQGLHFYWYRLVWRAKRGDNMSWDAVQLLNEATAEALEALKPYPAVYEHYCSVPYFEDFIKNKTLITEYL